MQDGLPGPRISAGDVCAVLVTYHPDADFPARLRLISPQVGAVVIVDNGSGDAAVKMLHDLARTPFHSLVCNPLNLGVAQALNAGIERAVSLGFGWVLLLDQDTRCQAGLLQALSAIYQSLPDRERVAVLGSGFKDFNHRAPQIAGRRSHHRWEEATSVITSGSLLPMATHALIGPFREEFFIDHVDTDYCYRARAMGYRIINAAEPLMCHAIGAPSGHQLLWAKKWTTNHSPDRRYYFARNDTVMLRDFGDYSWGLWALKSFGRRMRSCKRIILYERDKGDKIIAVAQGWYDGVRGKMGPRRPLRAPAATLASAHEHTRPGM